MGQSLQVLVDKGKQVTFGKPFCGLVSSRVIIKDKTRAVVQGRQVRTSIITILTVLFIVTSIIIAMEPSADLSHFFASFNADLEQSAL